MVSGDQMASDKVIMISPRRVDSSKSRSVNSSSQRTISFSGNNTDTQARTLTSILTSAAHSHELLEYYNSSIHSVKLTSLKLHELDSLKRFVQKTNSVFFNFEKDFDYIGAIEKLQNEKRKFNFPKIFYSKYMGRLKNFPVEFFLPSKSGNYEKIVFWLNKLSLNEILQTSYWNTKKILLKNIPFETYRAYFKHRFTKIKPLKEQFFGSKNQFNEDEDLTADLSILSLSDFGEFYLFDIVKDTCCHADKVFDVVKQTLSKYELQFALDKVTVIPVNYFSNVKVCDSLYLLKANELQKHIPNPRFPVIDSADFELEKGSDDLAPTEYLRLVYQLAADREPDIISSSYIGLCDDKYFQVAFSESNIKTNYFSAADNDSGNIDKSVFKRRRGDEFSTIEPIATYLECIDYEPVTIVGNQTGKTTFAGWYSGTGKNVGALGKGVHWGKKGFTSCIDSLEDVGTSYATPDVATKLFIAKAYWRKKSKETITALDARLRLLLSTDLEPFFVNKFASAGSINLNKLLQTGYGYLVKHDNEIIPIDTVWSSSVSTLKDNSYNEIDITATPSSDVISFRGFYFKQGKAFAFKNGNSLKWEEITKPDKINLTVRLEDGTIKPITAKDFYENYQQIVILK